MRPDALCWVLVLFEKVDGQQSEERTPDAHPLPARKKLRRTPPIPQICGRPCAARAATVCRARREDGASPLSGGMPCPGVAAGRTCARAKVKGQQRRPHGAANTGDAFYPGRASFLYPRFSPMPGKAGAVSGWRAMALPAPRQS